VYIVVALTEHVPQGVMATFVLLISTAHRVKPVVIVVKVLTENVLDLVLENCVNIFTTADRVNIVVLMEHVP
jgi:hypothetical protein